MAVFSHRCPHTSSLRRAISIFKPSGPCNLCFPYLDTEWQLPESQRTKQVPRVGQLGRYLMFRGDDAATPDETDEILHRQMEHAVVKSIRKQNTSTRSAKIRHDARWCTFLSQNYSSTLQELVFIGRTSEHINLLMSSLPKLPQLRTLAIALDPTARHAAIPGLARIPQLPQVRALKLEGWNRDLWACLSRTCTNVRQLRLLDLQGSYEGSMQTKIMQKLIDACTSSLETLRLSLFYEAGLNLRSLSHLKVIKLSLPQSSKCAEDDEATYDTLPNTGPEDP
ncbi:hypothetical protein CYLTODRAFT_450309 [Cylindrobasidium torrendii FP15055 ss-10]|uniref:F-box domain-containing protein n=1 Tax=Cylindrobasidium torrendii FP15055 ss-10 TaxID=1314674 RepID=A0A0D7BQV5_9AGAR|nr:hypothetical protein CYLTODRAFT_450309 [Cylindrobasidium torrendii FP15055 ss-10]